MNLKLFEKQIEKLEDIEEIKKLQKIYGYYLDDTENDVLDDLMDLFSNNTESIEICEHGVYMGKQRAREFFKEVLHKDGKPGPPWTNLHLVIQLQGIIHINKDGIKAKGRWQGWMIGTTTIAGVARPNWGHVLYDNDYVKEDGKWKFKKIHANLTFRSPFEDGWVKTPMISNAINDRVKPDKMPSEFYPYPSGYKVPYHWVNSKTANKRHRNYDSKRRNI